MPAPVTRDDIFALLAIARFGACATSPDGTFVFWNHRAEQILGLPATQILGRRYDEVIETTRPHQRSTEPSSNRPPLRRRGADGTPSPLTASIRCASGGHKQIVLTPVMVADQPGSDALTVYLFDDTPIARPPDHADRQTPERRPSPQPQPAPIPTTGPPSPPGHRHLSRRETEILRLVAAGTATEQIATDLHISVHTVRNHVRSLRRKLNAKTKLDAVVTALHHDLI